MQAVPRARGAAHGSRGISVLVRGFGAWGRSRNSSASIRTLIRFTRDEGTFNITSGRPSQAHTYAAGHAFRSRAVCEHRTKHMRLCRFDSMLAAAPRPGRGGLTQFGAVGTRRMRSDLNDSFHAIRPPCGPRTAWFLLCAAPQMPMIAGNPPQGPVWAFSQFVRNRAPARELIALSPLVPDLFIALPQVVTVAPEAGQMRRRRAARAPPG